MMINSINYCVNLNHVIKLYDYLHPDNQYFKAYKESFTLNNFEILILIYILTSLMFR